MLRLVAQADVFLTNYLPSVLDRLGKIVMATRPESPAAPAPASDPRAMVAAAQAFAERARSRIGGRAA